MLRRNSVTSRVAASTPSMRMRPLLGSMRRLTILRLVVLPQPDGPTRTQILPAGTVNERSFTAPGTPFSPAPYVLLTWRNSTVAAPAPLPTPGPLAAGTKAVGLEVTASGVVEFPCHRPKDESGGL